MTKEVRKETISDPCPVLKVERPIYDKQQFNNALDYNYEKEKTAVCSNPLNNFQPCKMFLSIFPVFSWMSKYDIRKDLISDLISGFTVGVMHIPQGSPTIIFPHIL